MRIWIDGSGASLPGQRGRACVVFEDGETKVTRYGTATNNEMEYQALLNALKDGRSNGAIVHTDSRLLVGHLTEGWRVKAPNLKDVQDECAKLLKERNAKLAWIPRGQNRAGRVLERRGKPSAGR